MIRAIVTTTLGAALLVAGAVPAQAEKAPPRPAKAARAGGERPAQARPLAADPDARAQREASTRRGEAASRALRREPSPPHPFRGQVRPEGRV